MITRSGLTPELLTEMSDRLRHRGPDDEGFLAHSPGGPLASFRGDDTVDALRDLPHWGSSHAASYTVGMCHRRLSILDLSPAGHQPMVSADGNLALVFNGEIYNYLEVADELESLGWRLRPCGDTAVLMAAFSQWGPACVHRLRGMWAFAVYDRQAQQLTLSRDRFGIKPLYYARSGDALVFGSEIKAILAAFPGDPRGSATEVVRLLTWGGMDNDETTLFEDVRAVPAACNVHISGLELTSTVERYYDIAARSTETFEGSVENGVDEYRERFSESIRLHMRSDVRVGTCLSGGLDSSLIAAEASSQINGARLPTFTAVYDEPALDERRYVELHAARTQRLDTRFVSPTAEGLLADLDRLVWAQDQPMASSSPFAQWSVMQLAGTNRIKVLLDGQGADEAIGGYSYFAGAYLFELVRRGRVVRASQEARRLRDRRGIRILPEVSRAGLQQLPVPFRRQARRRMRIGQQLVLPRYRVLAGEPQHDVPRTYRDYCVHAIQRGLPQLLRYEDRSSMAFSIESRVPFLDHPLVELVLSLPTEMKINRGWSKLVQRKAAEGIVPDEIVWRRDKLGFATPQRAWKHATVGRARHFVREVELPDFLDRTRVEKVIAGDLGGAAMQSEYWQMIFLLRWMHVFRVRFT